MLVPNANGPQVQSKPSWFVTDPGPGTSNVCKTVRFPVRSILKTSHMRPDCPVSYVIPNRLLFVSSSPGVVLQRGKFLNTTKSLPSGLHEKIAPRKSP